MNTLTKAAVQGAACGLMIGAVLLIDGHVWHPATVRAQGNQPAVADVVRAQRFELVDTAGKVRAVLSVLDNGTSGLTLRDTAGKTRMSLWVQQDGYPDLAFYDATGKARASLNAYWGSPKLYLSDAVGELRASLELAIDGTPSLYLQDATGKPRVQLSVEHGGAPSVSLRDAAGNARVALGTTILTVAKTGEERTRPESSLVLFDKDGKVMWQAP